MAQTNKYLTFELAKGRYGLGHHKIREIVKVMEITPLPHASDSVKGVINLRGKIIPVVDLWIFPSDRCRKCGKTTHAKRMEAYWPAPASDC